MSVVHRPRILNAVTTGTSTVIGPSITAQTTEYAFYTTFGPGTTAGVVVIETAPYENYSGTWANIATLTWATTDTTHRTNATGVHMALRARVTTTIVDGTVTVDFLASGLGK